MTNTREEVAVAEAIRPWLNRSSPNASQHVAEQAAKAAIAASNSKYVAGLVEALKALIPVAKNYYTIMRQHHEYPEYAYVMQEILAAEQAINTLPQEIRQ